MSEMRFYWFYLALTASLASIIQHTLSSLIQFLVIGLTRATLYVLKRQDFLFFEIQ